MLRGFSRRSGLCGMPYKQSFCVLLLRFRNSRFHNSHFHNSHFRILPRSGHALSEFILVLFVILTCMFLVITVGRIFYADAVVRNMLYKTLRVSQGSLDLWVTDPEVKNAQEYDDGLQDLNSQFAKIDLSKLGMVSLHPVVLKVNGKDLTSNFAFLRPGQCAAVPSLNTLTCNTHVCSSKDWELGFTPSVCKEYATMCGTIASRPHLAKVPCDKIDEYKANGYKFCFDEEKYKANFDKPSVGANIYGYDLCSSEDDAAISNRDLLRSFPTEIKAYYTIKMPLIPAITREITVAGYPRLANCDPAELRVCSTTPPAGVACLNYLQSWFEPRWNTSVCGVNCCPLDEPTQLSCSKGCCITPTVNVTCPSHAPDGVVCGADGYKRWESPSMTCKSTEMHSCCSTAVQLCEERCVTTTVSTTTVPETTTSVATSSIPAITSVTTSEPVTVTIFTTTLFTTTRPVTSSTSSTTSTTTVIPTTTIATTSIATTTIATTTTTIPSTTTTSSTTTTTIPTTTSTSTISTTTTTSIPTTTTTSSTTSTTVPLNCEYSTINVDKWVFDDTVTGSGTLPSCLTSAVTICEGSRHQPDCILTRLIGVNWETLYPDDFTVYVDNSCNVRTTLPGGRECGRLTLAAESPISLLWGINDVGSLEPTQVDFPLNPKEVGKKFTWLASATTPLLVFDPEHKGVITSPEQLFGPYAFGGKAFGGKVVGQKNAVWKDGYEALASLDKNGDTVVSGAELASLGLWFDNNRNGVSEEGEVKTLSSVDVKALYYKGGQYRADRDMIVLNEGYKRMINGAPVKGTSIDWFGYSSDIVRGGSARIKADTNSSLSLPSLVGNADSALAPEGLASLYAGANRGFDNISGLWRWRGDALLGNIMPQGLLVLHAGDRGQLTGRSITMQQVGRVSENEKSPKFTKVTVKKLKGLINVGKDGTKHLQFTVGRGAVPGGETATSAIIDNNGKMTGRSATRAFNDKGAVLRMEYDWTTLR